MEEYKYEPPEEVRADQMREITRLNLLKVQVFMDKDSKESGWDWLFPMDEDDIENLQRYAG